MLRNLWRSCSVINKSGWSGPSGNNIFRQSSPDAMPGGLYKYPEPIRATWTVFHPPTPFSSECLPSACSEKEALLCFVCPFRIPPTFSLLAVQKQNTGNHMWNRALWVSQWSSCPRGILFCLLQSSSKSQTKCSPLLLLRQKNLDKQRHPHVLKNSKTLYSLWSNILSKKSQKHLKIRHLYHSSFLTIFTILYNIV